VLRSTDNARGSVSHRRMCLKHITNLLMQVLGCLTEVEVLEWVTTRVVRCVIGFILWIVVIKTAESIGPW